MIRRFHDVSVFYFFKFLIISSLCLVSFRNRRLLYSINFIIHIRLLIKIMSLGESFCLFISFSGKLEKVIFFLGLFLSVSFDIVCPTLST